MNCQNHLESSSHRRKDTPFFSVIMPCFNSEGYISESIESVLQQTEEDFELVVVDDFSTDNSRKIIQRFAGQDDRVIYTQNTRTRGASGARNHGAHIARGEWLCFLDSDDIFREYCLENRRKCIELSSINFFSSDFYRWTSNSKLIPQSVANIHWKHYFSQPDIDGLVEITNPIEVFLEGVVAWTGAVTLRKSLFIELNGFFEGLKRAEDHHLWLRCIALTKTIGLIKKPDVLYRIRYDGLSGGINRKTSYVIKMYDLLLEDPLFSTYKKEINHNIDRYLYLLSLSGREQRQWYRATHFGLKFWLRAPFDKKRFRNLIGACLYLK
ncbi:Glycosyltransferase involved in cell wall bisynthesis [Marinobacter antarcticus]|uniref:Glycosyltransferase involved in cell wall bisynthesis n=1 Tax=Marinobacter antarcticus TaxID=564117 RepID=A0A1M6SML1_9GAMM|nr:glycosyltransferase family 2 protein [Marinobacter antarcticus]SHK46014.1 Glycosyltransferase involved in cell wall bisynthesis [Marinobacter antarcticus]